MRSCFPDLHRDGPGRPVPCPLLAAALLGLLATVAMADAPRHPDTPGTLFVEGGAAGERAHPLRDEADDVRTWTWDWGALVVTDPDIPVTAALDNLSLPYGTDLSGASRGLRLLFQNGEYPIDGPLLLRGAGFLLFAARGALTVSANALVLAERTPSKKPAGGQFLLFLGVFLLTVFMMMKARARTKRS